MKSAAAKTIRVVLERAGDGPHFVLARIPLDLRKAWPEWSTKRVCGEINGFAFRTSLFPSKNGSGYALVVNKKMQAGAHAGPGDKVQIQLEPDPEKSTFAEPKELTAALRADRQLRRWFDAMTPSMRKGFTSFVDQAKGAETRKQRAEKMAETLMLAMEGEQETPPILRIEFERQPLVRKGWEAMTSIQRRNHLLGIFYPQTVQGRTRRAKKAVEECLRVAQRKECKSL